MKTPMFTDPRQNPHVQAGFTLVEIMLVVAIIGLLAAIAIPAFSKARNDALVSKFLNDVRISVDYAEMYAMANGTYPPDVGPATAPDGAADYQNGMDWTAPTPLGGQWDWDHNSVGISAGVTVIGAEASLPHLQSVDAKIDDGDLLTGIYRRTGAGGYSYVIAD